MAQRTVAWRGQTDGALPTLLAQRAPQRSTQYSSLAEDLAPHELRLSPVGRKIGALQLVTLGGQAYLECELRQDLDERDRYELGCLAMTSAFFLSYAEVGGVPGPFLQPIETGFAPPLPTEMAMTRRYRGKTAKHSPISCATSPASAAPCGRAVVESALRPAVRRRRSCSPLHAGAGPQAWSKATRTSSRRAFVRQFAASSIPQGSRNGCASWAGVGRSIWGRRAVDACLSAIPGIRRR